MFTIKKYSQEYQQQYCDLYTMTWKSEPYGELFERTEILNHLPKNEDYLYLLVEEEENKLIGFVGGRPIVRQCPFFINEADVDLNSTFYVAELAIDEKHRNIGWGKVLTLYLMGCAGENNFTQFVLRTHSSKSNPAIRFYEKLGFTTRKDKDGKLQGVNVKQKRIDGRSETDFRIYFYKTFA